MSNEITLRPPFKGMTHKEMANLCDDKILFKEYWNFEDVWNLRKKYARRVIVSKQKNFFDYLVENAILSLSISQTADIIIIDNLTEELATGSHVITEGIVPLYLASFAWKVTEVPIEIPKEDLELIGDKQLSLKQIYKYAKQDRSYFVSKG